LNIKSIFALALAVFVLVYGIFSSGNVSVFLNEHAFMIVIGGTIAASSISFQVDRIIILFKVFFKRIVQGRKYDYVKLIRELMTIADAYRKKSSDFDKLIEQNPDFFLKEAFGLAKEELLSEEDLIRVLRMRLGTMYQRHMEEMIRFRTVGKFPPAFGLMGTTLSMISLLQNLGQEGGMKLIGPAMAVGLVATFFGLALSNLVFTPIAENLQDSAKEIKLKNLIIVEGVRLILQGTGPVFLAEELNSFLLPGERIDWKKVEGGSKAA
jgi:chemotaxis protein MotA